MSAVSAVLRGVLQRLGVRHRTEAATLGDRLRPGGAD